MAEEDVVTTPGPSENPGKIPRAPAIAPPRDKPVPRRLKERRSSGAFVSSAAAFLVCAGVAVLMGRDMLAEAWVEQGSRESLERAVAWAPSNRIGWFKLAALEARESGEPAAGLEHLQRAAELGGSDATSRIDLSLALEAAGNVGEAETTLLAAAEVDPGFLPRWALANFYLRQGREDEYWKWTGEAVQANPRLLSTAMNLSWRAFDDGDLILEKGVPDTAEVNRAYFTYLIDTNRLGSLLTIWPRLEADLKVFDVPNVALYLDQLLLADQVDKAVEVWNALCTRGYVPFQALSLDQGPYLTNGDFSSRINGLGFDWKVPNAEGVTRVQTETGPGQAAIEIRLSGAQPEYTQLLMQMTPIQPGHRYVLIYEYATQQLPAETGIGWIVRDGRTEQIIAEPASLENAEDFWYETSFGFDAPDDVGLLRLELKYQRVPGTTRQRGRFVMRNLRLERLGPAGADSDEGAVGG